VLHLDDGEQAAPPKLLQIPRRVHALYEAYCDIRLAPVAAPPVDDDESAGGAQQQPAAAGGEQQRAAAGALHAPVPQAEIDPLEATTPLVQKQFFEQILLDVAHGNSPPYAEWEQLEVVPPNPLLCGTCEDADGYSDGYAVKPIRFWSHEMWGIETPCANHGWAHSQFVTLGQWHMRRVKDVFDDFYLAGRRTSCSTLPGREAPEAPSPRTPRRCRFPPRQPAVAHAEPLVLLLGRQLRQLRQRGSMVAGRLETTRSCPRRSGPPSAAARATAGS